MLKQDLESNDTCLAFVFYIHLYVSIHHGKRTYGRKNCTTIARSILMIYRVFTRVFNILLAYAPAR